MNPFYLALVLVVGGSWVSFFVSRGIDKVSPNFASLEHGDLVSGRVVDLLESDDRYFSVRSVGPNQEAPAEIVVPIGGNTVFTEFNQLTVVIEAKVNTPNVQQKIELFDFFAGKFELLDCSVSATDDRLQRVTVSKNPTRFVTPGSGSLLARISFDRAGPTILFPWQADIDLLQWQLSD